MSANGQALSDGVVQAIKDAQRPVEIEIADDAFSSAPLYIPPAEPLPATLELHTLSGLVAYLVSQADAGGEALYVHVESPSKVKVYGPMTGRHRQRISPVKARLIEANPTLGQYETLESAIINLQTAFVATDVRANLLRVLGNVTDSMVAQFDDDGISQSVTGRRGVSLDQAVRVPNPVPLKPYRTFTEVDQPESLFVVRVKAMKDQPPQVAIFEADGGAWQNTAITSIAEYLQEKLGDKVTVIA